MKIGQKGVFRAWGSTAMGEFVTVRGHQDAGFLSIQKGNGRFVTFSNNTGEVIGDAEVAGGWERVTFDGSNIMLAQPDGPVLPYEWFSL